jgi:hypothetical protein
MAANACERLGDIRAVTEALRQRAQETIDRSKTLSLQVRDTWRRCASYVPLDVGDFRIRGVLEDGSAAVAYHIHGRLDCDDALRRRAELVVALGERFAQPDVAASYEATLDGDPVAVALTLARAMHVESFEMRLSGDVLVEQRFGALELRQPSIGGRR